MHSLICQGDLELNFSEYSLKCQFIFHIKQSYGFRQNIFKIYLEYCNNFDAKNPQSQITDHLKSNQYSSSNFSFCVQISNNKSE